MIYGAYGYTGELIARAAVARGHRPLLGGRRPQPLEQLAGELDLDWQAFQLESRAIVERRLEEVSTVLLCAGPFSQTSHPIVEACVATGTHYVDITGEIEVFEALAARHEQAVELGLVFLPGAGFDVVPTDCLAVHLKDRLPSARRLTLAIAGLGGVSRGTALTMVEGLPHGGRIRRAGKLERVPAAWKSREVVFRTAEGPRRRQAVTIPWGDVSTAYHSTAIPDIEVYAALPAGRRLAMKATRPLSGLLATRPVQAFLKSRARSGRPGPSEKARRSGRCWLWGEAADDEGRSAQSWMVTPEGYSFTAETALAVVERVIAGEVAPGFSTPGRAFGADFVLGFEGVVRWDDAP